MSYPITNSGSASLMEPQLTHTCWNNQHTVTVASPETAHGKMGNRWKTDWRTAQWHSGWQHWRHGHTADWHLRPWSWLVYLSAPPSYTPFLASLDHSLFICPCLSFLQTVNSFKGLSSASLHSSAWREVWTQGHRNVRRDDWKGSLALAGRAHKSPRGGADLWIQPKCLHRTSLGRKRGTTWGRVFFSGRLLAEHCAKDFMHYLTHSPSLLWSKCCHILIL